MIKNIYIIVLNYNNYDDSYECINSLLKLNNSFEYYNNIILVDNASSDGSGERLKKIFNESVIYLQSDINCGYAAGNNIGIKYAIEHNADFICVLNNDTVSYENFLIPCVKYLENHKNVAFISPAIEEYKSDNVQSTGGDIILKKGLVTVKNSGKKRKDLQTIIESDYIGGACLIFKTQITKDIGLIPENYFLFFEETEWCYRAKKRGFRNVCLTDTYIKHKGSASIDSISGLHAYLMERNRIVFLKRNSPNKIIYIVAVIYLKLKYIKKAIFEDKEYLKYLKYINDGEKNKIDSKYPFIIIKE